MMRRCLVGAACLIFSIQVFANVKADQAAAAYAQRDFNQAGIKMASDAAELYAQAVASETDPLNQLNLQLDQATAHYFLGTAMEKKDDRKAQHTKAMEISDSIMVSLGVDPEKAHELSQAQVTALLNKYDASRELILADAMYSKGINLSQWGRLNGVAASLGRLPEVIGLMERIEMLGYESIHEYGPFRTIGRIKFVLPKIFGGDLVESERYLKDALRNSLADGQRYSVNGYNNVYLAETIYKLGKENQAKKLLELFLSADPATLKANSEPENREALRLARELVEDWK